MAEIQGSYYVPSYSKLPFFTALGLFCLGYGSLNLMHSSLVGTFSFIIGAAIIATVMFFWFREIIVEHDAGYYDEQMDRSFNWGILWFIFAELCFFGVFFGAFFYIRIVTVPALGGHGTNADLLTHLLLWPNFQSTWPLINNPNSAAFPSIKGILSAWGLPAINTLVLLISAISVTWAHTALKRNARFQVIFGLLLTIFLGLVFLFFQSQEYILANGTYGLKLSSGIYGSTLFMLTGTHAAHVLIGIIMLSIIMLRSLKGHFTPDDHFAFKTAVWFWQFITVIWLLIFIFLFVV